MKVNFNAIIKAGFLGIEVEGKDINECRNKLLSMSFEDLLENIKSEPHMVFDSISEARIVSRDYIVRVRNIVYDNCKNNDTRPTAIEFKLYDIKEEDVEEYIEIELVNTYRCGIESFEFEVAPIE